MYAYAWAKDPIINGIIAQCGAAGSMPPNGGGKRPPTALGMAAGDFIKVLLLVGNTDYEAGLRTAIAAAAGGKNPFGPTSSGPDAAMMDGVSASSLPTGLSGLLSKDFDPTNIVDSLMTSGSASAASVRIKNNILAWRYMFHGD